MESAVPLNRGVSFSAVIAVAVMKSSAAAYGIDSGVSHQVSGIEYEAARAAAFMGYKIICDFEKIEVTLDTSSEIPRYTDSVWNGYLANISRSYFIRNTKNFCLKL